MRSISHKRQKGFQHAFQQGVENSLKSRVWGFMQVENVEKTLAEYWKILLRLQNIVNNTKESKAERIL